MRTRAIVLMLLCATPLPAQQVVDESAWEAAPASGVTLKLATEPGRVGDALRVDFDFNGGGGWAAFRKKVNLQLPANYEISFWLKGDAPSNTLEFKLVDATGDNVWWVNRPEFEFRGAWKKVTFRKRHITFAWGPKGGGEITDVAAIEFAITAGQGGRGTVWIDDITITPRAPVLTDVATPVVTRTADTYSMDLGAQREYGGVAVEWRTAGNDRDYDVQTSADAQSWLTVRRVRAGRRIRDDLQLPDMESRYLRIVTLAGDSAASISAVHVAPLEFGASRNRLFEDLAARSGADFYPSYFANEQTYWTVVGNPGDKREAMINTSGAVEVDKRSFTLEPFIHEDGLFNGWGITQAASLERGYLPIPTVTWQRAEYQLRITTWSDAQALWVRYRVTNRTAQRRSATLYVAIRPFQVNPPTQFLNTPGGATRITRMSYDGARVHVDARNIVPVTKADGFGAATYDQGDITDYLRRKTLPRAQAVVDSAESLASGALSYALELEPFDTRDVYVAVPFASDAAPAPAEASLAASIAAWRAELERFNVSIPMAPDIGPSLRSNLAWILINQDSAAIQPGSRSYERSWIRDGSLTSVALLQLGHAEDVKRFIEWYAPFQYADGKVPCCVDYRGADPVPENDSHGQLIYLVAEYFRYTGDTALVKQVWPQVERAVAYMDSLRNSRRTAQYRGTGFWGMLPQSISHEGYSAKPMHSYWDDFFALKGFKDATWLAGQLGDVKHAREWARMRDEFNGDLVNSFKATMREHNIDYLAGSVELGDFDATSTTVGLNPAGARHDLPQAALKRTFDKYWDDFVKRRANWALPSGPRDTVSNWKAYTPYEWRVVGSLVRLGETKRAVEAVQWFMQHQRPDAWNHWAEVVYRNAAAPSFIGDMPHTWVGSDFIRSVLDMFVYDDDDALVIAAGVPAEWVEGTIDTTVVSGVRTPYGEMSYRLFKDSNTPSVHYVFDSAPRAPVKGFVIHSIYDQHIRGARADGRKVPHTATEVRLKTLPRELILSH